MAKKKMIKKKVEVAKPRGKEVCVVCQMEKKGAEVQEDVVIRGIRKVKKFLRASTGNRLVVCQSCEEAARKKRQTFERTLLTYLGLGGIVLLIVIIFSLLSGGPLTSMLWSVFILLVLVLLLASLSLLNYFPSFEGYGNKAKGEKKEEKQVKRKWF